MKAAKRGLRGGAVAACVGIAVLGAGSAPAVAGGIGRAEARAASRDSGVGSFANPANPERPMYRFWSPIGTLSSADVDRQVRQMAESGAGGFENVTFTPAVTQNYDAATQSWGTPAWTRGAEDLFQAGKAHGMRVDALYTAKWSAGLPTVTPDGPASAKEITLASAWVDAGAAYADPDGGTALPVNALPREVNDRHLVAALAYRCEDACDADEDGDERTIPVLDQRSVVDLTDELGDDGTLRWTAPGDPAGTRWAVVTIWSNGTGQLVTSSGMPSTMWLVDHFSQGGIGAIKDFWDEHVFSPTLRRDMARSGGSIFFDSLELDREGNQTLHWTPAFLDEFRARRGYDITPYLAAIGVNGPEFEFAGDLGRRIREDYNQTLSDLFRDNHLLPLQEWAHGLGMTVRGQAYSSWGPSPLDVMEMYTLQDIPEGEDRSFTYPYGDLRFIETRGSDVWRAMSSAAAWSDNSLVSTECCAVGNQYRYSRDMLAAHVNQQFSVGVTQMVWHAWPDNTPSLALQWPGWSPFRVGGISDHYGPHNPSWEDDRTLNDYVARTQSVLRTGTLRRDVAIYHQGIGHSDAGLSGDLYFTALNLEQAGYQYGFVNKTMAAERRARVAGRRLDPDGQRFKAFVFDNTPNVNTQTGALDLGTAQKMLGWAKAGLPIVFVGDLPSRVFGNHPDQDEELQATIAALTQQRTVTRVATQDEALGALRSFGVEPSAGPESPQPLVGVRRETRDTNYHFLFDNGPDPVSTEVTLAGAGVPYQLDAWTGEITPIARYERVDGGVKVDVSLQSGGAAIFAVSRDRDFADADGRGGRWGDRGDGHGHGHGSKAPLHAIRTTADDVVHDERDGGRGDDRRGGHGQGQGHGDATGLAVRAGAEGWYATELSDRRTVKTAIRDVPAPSRLSQWRLDVESWSPGAGLTDVLETPLPQVQVAAGADGRLPAWIDLPGLGKISGIGVYTTTVDLGRGWTGGHGATLDLGEVAGSFTVKVNNRSVDQPDQLDSHAIDLGDHLRPGRNTIAVRVASALGNAAVTKDNEPYGLLGPVTLSPYGQAPIAAGGWHGGRRHR